MGLSIDPDACVFLFVGGLPARKNVEMLVEALTRARFAPATRWRCSSRTRPRPGPTSPGGPKSCATCVARAPRHPARSCTSTRRPTPTADMARLYRAATALVHPYRGEGLFSVCRCSRRWPGGTPVIVHARRLSTDDFVTADARVSAAGDPRVVGSRRRRFRAGGRRLVAATGRRGARGGAALVLRGSHASARTRRGGCSPRARELDLGSRRRRTGRARSGADTAAGASAGGQQRSARALRGRGPLRRRRGRDALRALARLRAPGKPFFAWKSARPAHR